MQAPSPPDVARLGYDILTFVGIIEHLARTRASRGLKAAGVSFPQFVLLNHFVRRPAEEAKTVSSVARAMQQPQPGITKTIQKMIAQGLLRVIPATHDRRVKLLMLTPKGQRAHQKALEQLAPLFAPAFEEWAPQELTTLAQHLLRLKEWLDTKGRLD